MSNESVSVLVVDDSALMRNLISKIIEADKHLHVAGTAMNGKFALNKIPNLNPDIIILDIEMPEMNGIDFLKERAKKGINIPVIILSSIATKGAKVTMEALTLGASDFITKPSGSISQDIHVVGEQITEKLYAYGRDFRRKKGITTINKNMTQSAGDRRQIKQEIKKTPASSNIKSSTSAMLRNEDWEIVTPQNKPGKIELIAIGISTGGPNALREVFAELKKDINVPIVVVQHMPGGFTKEFARSLDRICPLDVKEAEDKDLLKPGRILIAPGDKHVYVEKKSLASVLRLSDDPPMSGHKPSVDFLFQSVAKAYGNRCLAIIMTGMGKDGARQIGQIYKQGGFTLGQNEESCIVYGMPRVAAEHNYLHKVADLSDMADEMYKITKGS